jgi:hypothetical protein
MMKLVITVAEKGTGLVDAVISVCGKISLEVFGGSAGHDFFKEIIQFELHCSL